MTYCCPVWLDKICEKGATNADDSRIVNGYSRANTASETADVKIDFSLENLDLSELKGKATYEQIKKNDINIFSKIYKNVVWNHQLL